MRKLTAVILTLFTVAFFAGCEDTTGTKSGPPAAPFQGGTLSRELVLDETGIEFQATDDLDGSTFGATNGGIWYDDSEGKFKKVQDGSVTDLDTTGSGNLGSNLSSSSNDITTDNDVIQLIGTAEDLDVEFGANSVDITTDTGVTEIDFIGIALKDDGVALITGAANTIDSDQYVDESIDNAHLADDAVNSDEIASGAIDLDHMSANSVDSDQYVNGSIDAIHLAADVIDETKIADNGIDSEHYNDDSIDDAHINWGPGAGQVSADDIGDGSTNAIPTLTQETNWDTAYGWGDHGSAGYESATSNDIDPDRLAGDTDDDNLIDAALIDIDGATAETNIAADDKVLIYDTSGTAVKAITRGNFVSGIGAGQSVTFDIGDDGGNDSTDLGEIATENDTNSIVTLDDTDKMLIDMGQNWPTADAADAASSQAITDNAIATVDDADAAENDYAKFTANGLAGRSYSEVRQDLGIDTAANLESTLSMGAYFSDLAATTSEANFKETVNLEIGTDVLAQQTVGIADDNLLEVDGTPVNGEAAVFTANGINSLSEAEFKTAFNIEAGTDFEAVDAEILRADTNDTITADYTHSGTSTFNGEVTMGADFNLNANEIQSTGNVVFQLGDNAGSNVLEVEDSDGTAVWWLDSDGGTHTVATNNPAVSLNENDGTDYWFGINDTTTDRVELRRSATVNTNVDAYWDSDGAYVAGNMNIATGHTYQINGTQINIGNLGAGGNWTPTGSINLDSSTLTLNSDALTVDDGSNYTTVSNSSDDDTIDELLAAIDSWASGVSAGTLVTLSDVGGDDVYTAGYLIVGDGSDSYDPKAISGDVTLAADGAVTIAANAVENSMMADNAVDTAELAADAVEGTKIADDQIDSEHYVAGSIDNEHLADDAVDSDEIAAGAIDLAHMSAESVDSDQYVDGSIDNAHLADDAVDSDEIASGAIDLAHMSAESVDSDQYVDGSIDNAHLADDAVDSDEIADGAVDNVHLSDDAALAAYIAGDPDSLDDTLSTNPKLYRNGYIFYNAAGEATLDAFSTAGEAVSIEFVPSAAVIVNPNAAQTITLNGTALAQGEALINDSNWGLCVLFYAGSNSIRAACTSDIVQEVE
jgi:hypothetical protein